MELGYYLEQKHRKRSITYRLEKGGKMIENTPRT